MQSINSYISEVSIQLTETIPLNVYLVKGEDESFLVDSGIKDTHDALMKMLDKSGKKLKAVLHTHSHHDHIGGNAKLIEKTGCQIIAPQTHAHWHSDWEAHYNEFARPFPFIFKDTAELKSEVFDIMDAPHQVDSFCKEGDVFTSENGIQLECFMFSGHLLEEAGWYERQTKTLILGDVITLIDAPFIHGHLTVKGYRESLQKLTVLLREKPIEQILMAHFPPMLPNEFEQLMQQASNYLDNLEDTIITLLQSSPMDLKSLWKQTCDALEKVHEFRSLSTVNAHVQDLQDRRILHILPNNQIEYYGN